MIEIALKSRYNRGEDQPLKVVQYGGQILGGSMGSTGRDVVSTRAEDRDDLDRHRVIRGCTGEHDERRRQARIGREQLRVPSA